MADTPENSEKCIVIPLARLRWLLVTSVSFAIASILLYFALPGRTILDPIKGILAFLGATLSLLTCLWWIFSNRMLLLGDSRVMLLSIRSQAVLGMIPFEAVESIHFHHGEEEDVFYSPGVTIQLKQNRPPDVFWPWLTPADTDVVLLDRWVKSPESLRKKLRRLWQDYKLQQENKSTPPAGFSADVDLVG